MKTPFSTSCSVLNSSSRVSLLYWLCLFYDVHMGIQFIISVSQLLSVWSGNRMAYCRWNIKVFPNACCNFAVSSGAILEWLTAGCTAAVPGSASTQNCVFLTGSTVTCYTVGNTVGNRASDAHRCKMALSQRRRNLEFLTAFPLMTLFCSGLVKKADLLIIRHASVWNVNVLSSVTVSQCFWNQSSYWRTFPFHLYLHVRKVINDSEVILASLLSRLSFIVFRYIAFDVGKVHVCPSV